MLRPVLRKGRARGGGSRGRTITDLFVIVGQSNAEGRGTGGPASPTGRYTDGASITPLADPVGGAQDGSMWPSFANQWFSQTGHRACFIECATGNTALLAAADTGSGNWSPTGALRAAAASDANDAITLLEGAAGYTLGNVYFVWVQGERDAESNNGTTITATLYEQALEDLATYFKAQVPQMSEMLVVQLGNDGVTASRDAQYALYRQAQANACTDSALLRMVCTAGMSFSYRTPQWKNDGLHYDQAALNQLGSMSAYEAASPDVSTFTPSPTVTVDNYSGAVVGSRTKALTCQSTTRSIVVAVGIGKSASATGTVSSVTFGGKSFRQVQKSGSNYTTSPASAAQASIWILDEDDYAASLNSASGNVVVTFNAANEVLASVTIIESAEPLVIGSWDWEADSDGTANALSMDVYANSPALVVSCVAGRVSSDTPVTFTFSSGTEAADYGYNLDTNRSFTAATAYEVLSAAVYPKTITATASATMLHMGMVSASFRKRFNGETDVS